MKKPGGWQTEMLSGPSRQIGPHKLTPVARMHSVVRRQATFGTQGSRAWGYGIVWLQPAYVIVEGPDGQKEQLVIPDATRERIKKNLFIMLVLPLIYLLVIVLRSSSATTHPSTE